MDAISQLIHQLEDQPQWQAQRQFRQVSDCWPRVVGTAVATQTQPVRIVQGVLFVAVASSTWGQTLTFERLRILEKLNPLVKPPIRDIRFSTGEWFRRPKAQRQGNRSATSETAVLLRSHPSYCPPAVPGSGSPSVPKTAAAAFQNWANRCQQEARHQAQCPRCSCPCPRGELQRWSVCSLCAAKAWQLR